MEKRVLLAFFLSSLVLAAWYYFFVPPAPEQIQRSGQPTTSQTKTTPSPDPAIKGATPDQAAPSQLGTTQTDAPQLAEVPERQVRVETPFWRGTLSSRGAVPVSWTIKKMMTGPRKEIRGADGKELELIPQEREIIEKLGAPLSLVGPDDQVTAVLNGRNYSVSENNDTIQLREGQRQELVFSYQDASLTVTKKFGFFGDRFDFEFSVQAQRGNQPLEVKTILGPNFGDQSFTEVGAYLTGPQALASIDGGIQRIPANQISSTEFKGNVEWAGVEDNYFAFVLIPNKHAGAMNLRGTARKVTVNGEPLDRHFIASIVPIANGHTHAIFAGPKDPEILTSVGARIGHPSFEGVINYGIGGSFVKGIINYCLLPVFNFTYRFIPNYGVAILLITFIINMLFFPLKWKSSIKMKKAQAMQPKMKEIQEKIKALKKDDPQLKELQTEQLRLMREANPFGGCLPMLAQLPIFWAFFVLLTVSIDVRQAPFFGWIDNLSAPDTLTFFGFDVHVLPILMCISWMAQTIVMPTPASVDPTQAMQQRLNKILLGFVMPVVFTIFFFWRAPSGLVLYWMFNSLVGAGQQVIINRMMPPTSSVEAPQEPPKKQWPARPVVTGR